MAAVEIRKFQAEPREGAFVAKGRVHVKHLWASVSNVVAAAAVATAVAEYSFTKS